MRRTILDVRYPPQMFAIAIGRAVSHAIRSAVINVTTENVDKIEASRLLIPFIPWIFR